MAKKTTTIMAAITFAMITSVANATLINFGDGLGIAANGYVEAGMTIATTSTGFDRIADWQSGSGSVAGEREILDNDGASYTFSLVSAGTFDLASIDVEDPAGTGPNWSKFGSVDIIGSNGAIVNLLATVFGTQAFGSTFTSITSFTIQYADSSQLTFDNINFEANEECIPGQTCPPTVPAPNTIALLGLGLASLGFLRRKKAY